MLENLTMLLGQLNFLAVLVAGLAAMIIAGIWYNPNVMGKAWMRENGFGEKDLGPPGPAMAKAFVSNLVLAFGLASFFAFFHGIGVKMTLLDGAAWGFGLAVLVHGAAGYPNYAFEKRSNMLFLIHVINSALGMAVMGAILATWR